MIVGAGQRVVATATGMGVVLNEADQNFVVAAVVIVFVVVLMVLAFLVFKRKRSKRQFVSL